MIDVCDFNSTPMIEKQNNIHVAKFNQPIKVNYVLTVYSFLLIPTPALRASKVINSTMTVQSSILRSEERRVGKEC